MPAPYARDIPQRIYQQVRKIVTDQGRSISQAVEEEKLRRTRSKALANIRRRRRPLPVNAPDSVTLLRQIRGENE